ncbi:hypothetical protein MIND_01411100 [Mycena indigotica]|uniref:Cytochrome P450 n=1 Tax=Mycena indigotica TaxID=2126181 RepID=A0A8H6VP58_9AGAR|nr:uncharacterized protein MIND_01411100 [Mycena indigotica]KAF7288947.1 hypothetical protein MIND_01411100 [Mycena indigotica]
MITQIVLPIVATLCAYFVLHASQILYRNLSSPLRRILPGPPIPHYVLGNFKEMAEDARLSSKWRAVYGKNYLFHGLFSISELYTGDLKALTHIIAHPEIYQRPPASRDASRRLMGEGILFAEAEQHKRHRRVMNPAFGPSQIRAVTEIFVEKAAQLRDIWAKQTHQQGENGSLDVFASLRKMTLDVIGRAGFGYDFNALNPTGHTNELNQAFTDLLHSPHSNIFSMIRLAQGTIPVLKLLPLPGARLVQSAHRRMMKIGGKIVHESKAAILATGNEDDANEKDALTMLSRQRDLLSTLLKANMAPGLTERQRLDEEEVISQIPAFFVAGNETVAAATAWALHLLSRHQSIQDQLRAEVTATATDSPTLDELNRLPFLEKVVRETLRLHAPALFMQRTAMTDDVLPLERPVVDAAGAEHWSLPIVKGQTVHLPIWGVNTDVDIWGADALEFRPDRWDDIPKATSGIPGIWGNQFTFLGGQHNCIGFRFALAELKVLLFILTRAFTYAPAVPEGGIEPLTGGTLQRPAVLRPQQQRKGRVASLPLRLSLVQNAQLDDY